MSFLDDYNKAQMLLMECAIAYDESLELCRMADRGGHSRELRMEANASCKKQADQLLEFAVEYAKQYRKINGEER